MRLRSLLLCLLLVLPSILRADADSLPGIWWSPEDGVQLTFRTDGTLSIAAKEVVQQGHWSASGDQLLLGLSPPGTEGEVELTCRFRIAEDRLTIHPGDPRCGESSFERLR